MYGGKYALYSQFRDTPKDTTDEKLEEIKVIEIQNMIRIIYAEILVFILLTILHIILPGQIRSTYLQPILGNSFYWTQWVLFALIYSVLLVIGFTIFRKDFQFYVAKKSLNVAKKKDDEIKKFIYKKNSNHHYGP